MNNFIEHNYCAFESKWSFIFQNIIKKEIISNEEKMLIYVFMAIQLLRTPFSIELIEDIIKKNIPSIKEYQCKNQARINLLPSNLYNTNPNIYDSVLNVMLTYNLHIYYSKTPLLINDQSLVMPLIYPASLGKFKHDGFFATIHPHICIVLSNEKDKRTKICIKKWMKILQIE